MGLGQTDWSLCLSYSVALDKHIPHSLCLIFPICKMSLITTLQP